VDKVCLKINFNAGHCLDIYTISEYFDLNKKILRKVITGIKFSTNELSLQQSPETFHSLTVINFFKDGNPKSRVECKQNTKIEYEFGKDGRRILKSSDGLIVSTHGNQIEAIVDNNGFSSMLLMCRRIFSENRTSKSIHTLLPENNRAIDLPFVRLVDGVNVDLLGIKYRRFGDGTESLNLIEHLGSIHILKFNEKIEKELLDYESCTTSNTRSVQHTDPRIQFYDEKFATQAKLSPLRKKHFAASCASKGLVVFVGGSGEYDPSGYLRTGKNIGYTTWIKHLTDRGFDVLSLAKMSDAEIVCADYIQEMRKTIHNELESRDLPLTLIGHSLGGLIAAELAGTLHVPLNLVLLNTPAKGMQNLIVRQTVKLLRANCFAHFSEGKKYLRTIASGFNGFLNNDVHSIEAILRKSDKGLLKNYRFKSVADHTLQWKFVENVFVIQGECDEKVEFRNSLIWMNMLQKKLVRSFHLCINDGDHMFNQCSPVDGNTSDVSNQVFDFICEKLP
jgi:surfactin synthase thioesterase subunit